MDRASQDTVCACVCGWVRAKAATAAADEQKNEYFFSILSAIIYYILYKWLCTGRESNFKNKFKKGYTVHGSKKYFRIPDANR